MRSRDVLAFAVGFLLARLADAIDARYQAGRAECRVLLGRLRARETTE